jgi:hypothetical protein
LLFDARQMLVKPLNQYELPEWYFQYLFLHNPTIVIKPL